MNSIHPRRLFALAAMVAAAACNADSTVGPSTPATLDGALAEMALPAIANSPFLSFNQIGGPTPTLLSAGCAYSSSTQRFDCLTVVSSGFTVTQWFMLFDASGTPLSSWNPGATAAVRLHQAVHGYVLAPHDSTNVDVLQDLTLSGLLGGHHTLNGTQIAHVDETAVIGGASEHTLTEVSQQLTDVVLANSTDPATAWPISGTLTSDVTESGGAFPVHVRVAITFTGTSRVRVTISIDGATLPPCTMDLAGTTLVCT